MRKLAMLFVLLSLSAMSPSEPDQLLQEFVRGSETSYSQFSKDKSRDKFVLSVWRQADNFLLHDLNEQKFGTINDFVKRHEARQGYLVKQNYLIVDWPEKPIIHQFTFIFYEFTFRGQRHIFVRYVQDLIDGEEEVGYSTFRVFRYDPGKKKYGISHKFEDTNFFHQIASKQIYRGLDDRMLYFYDWVGYPKKLEGGIYFIEDRNGDCLFKLEATVPPQTSISHDYVIDWVLNKNGVLKATTLHWDIHEEPLPGGKDSKLVETTVALDNK